MNVSFMLVVLLTSFAGAFLQCLTGFGAGITMMLVLPYIFTVVSSVVLNQAMCLILNLYVVFAMYRSVNKKAVLSQIAIYYPVYFICIELSKNFDPNYFKPYLGVFFIALSAFCLLTENRLHLKDSLPLLIISGILCGVLGAFFGVMGPVAAIYMLAATNGKDEFMASTQMYFLLANLFSLTVRIYEKQMSADMLPYIAAGAVTLFMGFFLGRRVSKHIRLESMKKWVYAMVGICGLITVVTYFKG